MNEFLNKIFYDETGLYLCQLPTGYGKTFSVIQSIAERLKNNNLSRKIIYITPLKKNLPYNLLKDMLRDIPEVFENSVLELQSNIDCVKEKIEVLSIPVEFQSEKYFELIRNIKQLKKSEAIHDKDYLDEMTERVRKSEKNFRAEIYMLLKKSFSSVDERLTAIAKDKNYKWIGQLYPSVFTSKRQVVFMTLAKFLNVNSTLVEPEYSFIESDVIKNSVIIIDEFDSTKSVITEQMIKKSLSIQNEYLSLFNQIYKGLDIESMSNLLSESANRVSRKKLEYFVEEGMRISEQYHLNLSYKTIDGHIDIRQNFLFNDGIFHTIFQNGKKYMRVKMNLVTNQVEIRFESTEEYLKNKCDTDVPLFTMFRDIQRYINRFRNFLFRWTEKYRDQINSSRDKNQNEFTFEAAMKSILTAIKMTDNQIALFLSDIIHSIENGTKNNAFLDNSIYGRGIEIFQLEDNDEHNDMTYLSYIKHSKAAETIIKHISEKALVLGISATAESRTVLGNYNLDYLKNILGEKFHNTPSELTERVKKMMDKHWNCYRNGTVKVHFSALSENIEEYNLQSEICKITGNREQAEIVSASITQMVQESYYICRYYKIFTVMSEFWKHDDIKSMLCLGMALPSSDTKMNTALLKNLFEISCDISGNTFDNEALVFLTSNNFDTEKDKLLHDLSCGKKRFVISTYATIGAGQNLQYEINDNSSYVIIADKIDSTDGRFNSKDFDAIYLADITHLSVNMGEQITKESLVTLLIQIEELYYNGEITYNEKNKLIKAAFCSFGSSNHNFNNVMKKTRSFNIKATSLVIQAIGRMCRTFIKNYNIYIYMDKTLLHKIDTGELKRRVFPPEMCAIYDARVKLGSDYTPEQEIITNRAERISTEGLWSIRQLLSRGWTLNSMEFWEEMRRIVLSFPTASDQEHNVIDLLRKLYITSGRTQNNYYYAQHSDFKNVCIDFDHDEITFRNCSKLRQYDDGEMVVSKMSEEESGLKYALMYPGIRDFFESEGYALSFKPNKWMMSPVLFRNIYKGALGEVVGKYVLEHERGIQLHPISEPDKFEFFDFEMKPGIYVDFKNWKYSYNQDSVITRNEILRKLDAIGGKRVYVINLFYNENTKAFRSSDGRITEIPGILLKDGTIAPNMLDYINVEDYE